MILAGPDFRAGKLAVVITADEDDNHSDTTFSPWSPPLADRQGRHPPR